MSTDIRFTDTLFQRVSSVTLPSALLVGSAITPVHGMIRRLGLLSSWRTRIFAIGLSAGAGHESQSPIETVDSHTFINRYQYCYDAFCAFCK